MNLYATPQELAAFLDPDSESPEVPARATVLLRHAQGLVDRQVTESYRTDTDGHPTDPRILQALKDATCEQASAWSLADLDPRKGAAQVARRVASKSLNGASVSYVADGAADTAASQLASGEHLTSAAYAILVNAGLVTNRVGVTRPVERFNVSQRYYDPTTGALE